jgi:glycosyltransferase involved in cell wall biosynthesis
MRVALVTPGFEPEVGGIEAYVRNLADQLADLGCHVDVLTQCPRGRAREWDRSAPGAGYRVLRFEDWTGTRRFRIAPGLWQHLQGHGREYDVIHVHNFHAFPALASALATDCPLVFTPYYHGIGHTPAAKVLHVPYDRLAKRIFARSSYILCVSGAEVDLVQHDYPVFASRVHRVGIGIDIEGIRQAAPFQRDRPVVLVIGRLEPHKHIGRAVEAFAACDTDADLVIVGTGQQQTEIGTLVDRLGIGSRVQMLGYVEDGEARRWQRTATVVMSLSSAESFGLGVAEAAVADARIVASDIPAHRDVAALAGGTFEFVPLGAPTAVVAEALHRSLAAPRGHQDDCVLPTWREVGERILDFYGRAEPTSRGRRGVGLIGR